MKYVFIVVILGLFIITKLSVFNKKLMYNATNQILKEHSYLNYNWKFNKTDVNATLVFWQENQHRDLVRRLLYFDFIFILIYTFSLCHFLYNKMQHQNRLFINSWLRMSIFCVLLAGVLNLLQDGLTSVYLDADKVIFFPVAYLAVIKWGFIGLVLISIIVTLIQPPESLIKT